MRTCSFHRDREYRVLKLVLLFNRVITLFAFNTILIRFFFADDGMCEENMTSTSCITAEAHGGLRTACTWREDNDSCEFAIPDLSVVNLLLPLFAISLITVPLAFVMTQLAKWWFGLQICIS